MSALERARNVALKKIGRREHSSFELRRFLELKGFEREVSEQVVAEFVRARWIDDQRVTGALVRQEQSRGSGPALIRMKLRRKGISAELSEIREILGESSPYDELAQARELVARRYPRCGQDKKETARAYQGLLRKGFSHEVARAAVFKK